MRILLGSKNESKRKSLEKALYELEVKDYEIISYDVESGTNSKPIGFEILRGAEFRNSSLKGIAHVGEIEYDYLCSIEGGFEVDQNGLPSVVTYCIIEDKNNNMSTGKSFNIRITKSMFEFTKKGGSLNKIIKEITGEHSKTKEGIIGYLSNGLYNRDDMDSGAVISAFIPIIYKKERSLLDEKVKTLLNNNNK